VFTTGLRARAMFMVNMTIEVGQRCMSISCFHRHNVYRNKLRDPNLCTSDGERGRWEETKNHSLFLVATHSKLKVYFKILFLMV